MAYSFAGPVGGVANRPSNPSAAVGWVQIASRSAVYGMPRAAADLDAAVRTIAGSARSMGVDVEGV